MKLNRYTISALCIIVLIVCYQFLPTPGPGPVTTAPNVVFTAMDGNEIALDSLRGKPVIISFWSTSCQVCIEEMPALFALYERFHPQGLEIIGITMPYDPPDHVLNMINRRGIPYPVVLDLMGKYAAAFGQVAVTPTTFVIAPDGKVVAYHFGKIHPEELQTLITSLLNNFENKTG
jgi:peroxiredoxin